MLSPDLLGCERWGPEAGSRSDSPAELPSWLSFKDSRVCSAGLAGESCAEPGEEYAESGNMSMSAVDISEEGTATIEGSGASSVDGNAREER